MFHILCPSLLILLIPSLCLSLISLPSHQYCILHDCQMTLERSPHQSHIKLPTPSSHDKTSWGLGSITRPQSTWVVNSTVVHPASDPVVVLISCFYLDKVCSPPYYHDVLSQLKWSLGHRCGGKSGLVGMIGVMEIFNEGWETTVGAMGVGWGITGSAMMGHCLCQMVNWIDLSDCKDCFNWRVHLGLGRSSILISEGSSNTDLKSSGLDMLINGCAMKAVWCDHRVKDGNPWTNGKLVFQYWD